MGANVRFGSLADIAAALRNVRFTPDNGHHRNRDAGAAKVLEQLKRDFLLQPVERSAFLSALAVLFQGRSEIGGGEFGRSIRELQRQYFKPPTETETNLQAPRQPARKLG
jgi:hypothetical protein